MLTDPQTPTRDLSRLFCPKSVAVIGGGMWCQQAVRQLQLMSFEGEIWRVHPKLHPVEGVSAVPDVRDLPGVPDAAFVGVNRRLTVEAVASLSDMGAGGAVCFASGFSEALAEDADSGDLQADLVLAAGDMPILGPNCYGYINALEGALLWPDQHGCKPVSRGVAILTQSSNIAINLTMQRRGLPVGFVATCGNAAQLGQAETALALLEDPRITAIGLHVEGFGDVSAWHRLAIVAKARGVPLIVLKSGRSDHAQAAAVSHTASLAGSEAGAAALTDYLGIPQVCDLSEFLETLKILHVNGPLQGQSIASISCSGGEASLVADLACGTALSFPPLSVCQREALTAALGPMVALSNPLDYHTYIWGDATRMAQAWLPMTAGLVAITLIVLDYPHTDARDWGAATEAALAVRERSGRPVAVVATLPELLPEAIAVRLMAGGVIPLNGLREALAAVVAAGSVGAPQFGAPARPVLAGISATLTEEAGKRLLARHGVTVPRGVVAAAGALVQAAVGLEGPFALKALGHAHKTEAGAVRLGVEAELLDAAATEMPGDAFLAEEMARGAVAELLVGIRFDPPYGYLLTLGAGGTLTELWQDTVSLLLPVDPERVKAALQKLRIAPLLAGYRGNPGADVPAIIETVLALQACVLQDQPGILEAEINPLICTPDTAVAVDALIVTATERTAKK
ncbi:MAG: acetate--CoA ligase family protein [Pseudomonadota bacterium]